MEDLRVSLQSARHSFLQTVTGCMFPHSLHLPFVQGGESTAIKSCDAGCYLAVAIKLRFHDIDFIPYANLD
ncbi:hypothetical protein Bca101_002716 [Brassica carinata]